VYSYQKPTTEEVDVIGVAQTLPENAKLLGEVSIGDSGFTTKCSYGEVIKQAILQAQQMGGNLLYIKKHKEPDLWSSCHRIQCEVYKVKK
jgi:hypothetical protein